MPGHALLAWRIAHDGWLCTSLYNSSWKFHGLAAGQLLSGQPLQYGKGRRYGPSITYNITPAGSLSSSQPGGPPCWASPLAFGLTVLDGDGAKSHDRKKERDLLYCSWSMGEKIRKMWRSHSALLNMYQIQLFSVAKRKLSVFIICNGQFWILPVFKSLSEFLSELKWI